MGSGPGGRFPLAGVFPVGEPAGVRPTSVTWFKGCNHMRMTASLSVGAGLTAALLAVGAFPGSASAQLDPNALKNRKRAVPVEDVVARVNEEVKAMWQRAEVVPTKPASDSEWVRRVYLDLLGRIPTYKETQAFLGDRSKDKKEKLVDALLASDECSEHFSIYFGNLLVGRIEGQNAAEIGVDKRRFEIWAKESFANNKPWDQWVMELLTAKGTASKDPPTNFILRVKGDPTEVASRASQLFLGTQIQCAQCHNHPFDEWKQSDFWGMVGFFVRTRVRAVGAVRPGQLYREQEVADVQTNEEAQYYIRNDPRLPRQTQFPKFLKDEAEVVNKNEFNNQGIDRRYEFARWVTSPDNQMFSKAAANRMWYYFLGRGIVNPVDDMGSSKRPVSVKLLNELADDFTRSGFDLKRLIKVIVLSAPYNLSSEAPAGVRSKTPKPEYGTHFTHFYIKVMTPEQMFYSIVTATGGEDAKGGRSSEAYQAEKNDLLRQFTTLIDNDENKEVTRFEGSIPLALRLLNGDIINKRIQGKAPGLQYFRKVAKDDAGLINTLFLATLSRSPTAAEMTKIQTVLRGRKDESKYEDIFWALLNTPEFMFIH